MELAYLIIVIVITDKILELKFYTQMRVNQEKFNSGN